MKKSRKLRAPFVATIAIAASACGGRVDHVDASEPEPGSSNPPAQVADGGTGCPISTPTEGIPCAAPYLQCTYGECSGQPTSQATCTPSGWQVTYSTCNPPPPPPPAACPPTEPKAGAPCSPTLPDSCPYHQNECNEANGYKSPIAYSCRNGLWEITGGGSCNPPSPVCPVAPPQPGAPCYGGDLTCPYGDCYGYPTTTATCTGGTWNVMFSSCNPPVPDAGGGG